MSSYGIAGTTAIRENVPRALIWGGDRNQVGLLDAPGGERFSSTMVDAGSTPTTDIRAGLLLGKLDTGGELMQWDATASDGSQNVFGVNSAEFSTLDATATAIDKAPPGPIVRGPLRAASILIKGSALVGHTDEYLARRQLHAMGILLDDDPQGYLAGVTFRQLVQATSVTVTAAQNGMKFSTKGAAAEVEFTLPTLARGLQYEFYSEADQNLKVTAAANTAVVFNDLTATSVSFETASEKIGNAFKVRANDAATAWLVEAVLSDGTVTVTVV